MNQLIITIMGPDRPGIVADLAGWVSEHGGNWLESRLIHLGGQFTGALRIEIGPEAMPSLQDKLSSLRAEGLRLDWAEETPSAKAEPRRHCRLKLVAQDEPGIVQRIFDVFRKYEVNVEELRTETRGAPWSGHMLFEAEARLSLPRSASITEVREALEDLSNDLMVDAELTG